MRASSSGSATRLLESETIRFVITGGSAAAFFYLLTYALIELGAPPFNGTLAAYTVALVASYSVQHAWTFRGRQTHRRSFPRYLAAQAAAALVAGTVARACGQWGAPPAAVALASTLTGSGLSFVLSKFWVFAHRTHPDERS